MGFLKNKTKSGRFKVTIEQVDNAPVVRPGFWRLESGQYNWTAEVEDTEAEWWDSRTWLHGPTEEAVRQKVDVWIEKQKARVSFPKAKTEYRD